MTTAGTEPPTAAPSAQDLGEEISVENITKRFGAVQALSGVTLTFPGVR